MTKREFMKVIKKICIIIYIYSINCTVHLFPTIVRPDSFIGFSFFETIHAMQNQRNLFEQSRVGERRLMLFVYQTSFCSESIRNFVRLAERALPFLCGLSPVFR